MQKIILYLTNHLIQDNIIEEEERELYRYGFTVAFLFLVNVLTATILSITFGNIGVLSFFLFCMIPFRKLIGGFHNSTPLKCFFSNQILMLFIQKFYLTAAHYSKRVLLAATFFSVIFFLIFSIRRIILSLKYSDDYRLQYLYYVIFHFGLIFLVLLFSFIFSKPGLTCIIDYTFILQGILSMDIRNLKNESRSD